jgi:hypothetical protein
MPEKLSRGTGLSDDSPMLFQMAEPLSRPRQLGLDLDMRIVYTRIAPTCSSCYNLGMLVARFSRRWGQQRQGQAPSFAAKCARTKPVQTSTYRTPFSSLAASVPLRLRVGRSLIRWHLRTDNWKRPTQTRWLLFLAVNAYLPVRSSL